MCRWSTLRHPRARCCANSTPRAPPPTNSPRRRSPILNNTRTPRSSPVFPDLGCWPAPGCWPMSGNAPNSSASRVFYAGRRRWVSGAPPSIFSVTPVRKVLVIANSTASATSSAVPMRRAGLVELTCAKCSRLRPSPSESGAVDAELHHPHHRFLFLARILKRRITTGSTPSQPRRAPHRPTRNPRSAGRTSHPPRIPRC